MATPTPSPAWSLCLCLAQPRPTPPPNATSETLLFLWICTSALATPLYVQPPLPIVSSPVLSPFTALFRLRPNPITAPPQPSPLPQVLPPSQLPPPFLVPPQIQGPSVEYWSLLRPHPRLGHASLHLGPIHLTRLRLARFAVPIPTPASGSAYPGSTPCKTSLVPTPPGPAYL